MKSNNQQENKALTPMQKQAVLVCIVCALAALLTIGITLTMLKRGKSPTEQPGDSSIITPAPAPEGEEDISDHYQINETSSALLTGTADAGDAYQEQTLFIGDSNTVRLYANGLISLQQFCAKEGIGTQAALNEGIVTFKKDSNHYTIPQAVAMMKPRRVVMTFGTNDTGMEVSDFIAHYTALVQAVQQSYPYTDIIVNTVPPVPVDHSNYPHMDQSKIDDFNMALLNMCEQLGVRFLNSAEALKGSDGYGIADYYTSGDIHLKSVGLKAVLNYIRTHACQTDDRRPDTNNIPTRTMEYVSNPSSAVAAPSSEAASSSGSLSESASGSESSSSSESTSSSEGKKFEAHYHVDKNGGGTLSVGGDTGNNSVTYTVTDPSKSITVTAVPADGYVFVKWSDGLTSKTRTDTDFKQNLDVTAVFGAASVLITSEGKGAVGSSYTFQAALSGKYAKTENLRWYANGQEVTQAAGKSSITVVGDSSMVNASYKIHAVVTYNDCKVSSNTLTITIGSGASSESAPASSSPSSNAGSSGSTSASSSSASSGSSSSSSSGSSSHSTSSSSSASSSTSGSSKAESESQPESKAETRSESKAESKSEASASKETESKAE